MPPLRLARIISFAELVVPHVLRPHDLGERTFVGAAVHLHLPEPILCLHESLREEEVVYVLRVDVRYSPPVADDLDRIAKPPQRDAAVDPGERGARERGEGGFLSGRRRRNGGEQDDERCDEARAHGSSAGEGHTIEWSSRPSMATHTAARTEQRRAVDYGRFSQRTFTITHRPFHFATCM